MTTHWEAYQVLIHASLMIQHSAKRTTNGLEDIVTSGRFLVYLLVFKDFRLRERKQSDIL